MRPGWLRRAFARAIDARALNRGTDHEAFAENVLRRGHRIVGVDQAESLLELARKRFPDGTWLHGEIETFVPEGRFHAIVCWDALFHIDRSVHEALFERFAIVASRT